MIEHVSTSISTVKTILLPAVDQAVLAPNPYGFPLLLGPRPGCCGKLKSVTSG